MESCRLAFALGLLVFGQGPGGLIAQDRGATVSPGGRELGIQHLRDGRFQEAYGILVPYLGANPDDSEARLLAARCAAELGRIYEAAELLSGLDEGDPEVQLLWGRLLIDKRDPEGAVETLSPLMDDPPAELEPEIRRILAEAFLDAGRANEAVQLLEGHVGTDPDGASQLARALYEGGDPASAADQLQPFAKDALGELSEKESTSPSSPAIALVFEYGRCLVTLGRHSEAIPYLEAAVGGVPTCKPCWQQMAQAYAAVGRSSEALGARQEFQRITDREIPAADRDRQRAQDQQDPTGKTLREATGAFQAGRTDEALAILQTEGQLQPSDPRPPLLAARFLLDLGRQEDALQLAEHGIRLAPDQADGYFVRGTILMSVGDPQGAERDFLRVLGLEPDHRRAEESLQRLLQP